ncbi:MAG: hypothetical protein JWP44_4980 [Mucilaginibacter sp.]|nr:hypothetical protein [Mucilaginibacter sp.]
MNQGFKVIVQSLTLQDITADLATADFSSRQAGLDLAGVNVPAHYKTKSYRAAGQIVCYSIYTQPRFIRISGIGYLAERMMPRFGF